MGRTYLECSTFVSKCSQSLVPDVDWFCIISCVLTYCVLFWLSSLNFMEFHGISWNFISLDTFCKDALCTYSPVDVHVGVAYNSRVTMVTWWGSFGLIDFIYRCDNLVGVSVYIS